MDTKSDISNMWPETRFVRRLGTNPGRVSLVFVVGLLVCLVAGLIAPELFVEKSAQFVAQDTTTAATLYEFDISHYKRSHQSIYFSMRLNLPIQLLDAMELNDQTIYETQGRFTVTVYGSQQDTVNSGDCPRGCVSCPSGDEAMGLTCDLLSDKSAGASSIACERGDEWCSWLSLYSIDFVRHRTYYWSVETDNDIDGYLQAAGVITEPTWIPEFRVVFVSRQYTGFELAWFYSWIFLTLLAMFFPRHGFFTVAISESIPWSAWSRVQKWVAVLLVGLFFFNNPFFAAQIYARSPRDAFTWYAIAEGVVVSLLLLFWADRVFAAGSIPNDNRSRTKGAAARGAGIMLVALICVVYIVNMINVRVSSNGNPDRVHKYPYTSTSTERLLTVLSLIYCFWIIVLAGRIWYRGAAAKAKLRSSRRVQFFALSSFVTLILLLPAVIMEYLQPRVRGGAAFTVVRGGINLYVMALAVLCAPRRTAGEPSDEDNDDISSAHRTVNPMVHQRALEIVAEDGWGSKQQQPAPSNGSGRWWKGFKHGGGLTSTPGSSSLRSSVRGEAVDQGGVVAAASMAEL